MTRVSEMLTVHPLKADIPHDDIVRCIDALTDCAQTCTACADACLGEDDVQALVACIRANLDCADLCGVTARLLSRQTAIDWQLAVSVLDSCLHALEVCADECEAHADHHEHCRICAQACQTAAEAARALLGSIPEPSDLY